MARTLGLASGRASRTEVVRSLGWRSAAGMRGAAARAGRLGTGRAVPAWSVAPQSERGQGAGRKESRGRAGAGRPDAGRPVS